MIIRNVELQNHTYIYKITQKNIISLLWHTVIVWQRRVEKELLKSDFFKKLCGNVWKNRYKYNLRFDLRTSSVFSSFNKLMAAPYKGDEINIIIYLQYLENIYLTQK